MELCGKCRHLNENIKIQNLSDFKKAVRVIQDNLKDGTLQSSSYWPKDKINMNFPQFEREEWGDYVLYYFECSSCNALFKLSVEMYHGTGGSWQPIQKVDETN